MRMDESHRSERAVQHSPWSFTGIVPSMLSLAVLLQPAEAAENWKFEAVHLKNGRTFHGLVVTETDTQVVFKRVLRHPGDRTTVYETSFRRDEVVRIDRLTGKERDLLEARVKALDRAGEKRRLESLDLKVVPWGEDAKAGLSYTTPYFLLRSNAREDIVRRAALRLEQIYAAYVGFLPPRYPTAQPTTILLIKSKSEYEALLQKQGRPLLNPAFYDCAANQIVCASDLERLGDELERIRKEQLGLAEQLKQTEAKLRKEYKNNSELLKERLQEVRAAWEKIKRTNARNDEKFAKATRHLFQTLYHEAFHAYLANFVYPPAEAEVPRWLNEGLAQIFETAIVDIDELLVGRPDPERLKAAKAAEQKEQLVDLEDLLRADAKPFLVAHAGDKQVSDRYYLTSWALAFYISFECKKLGTPELDEYVRTLKRGADPGSAFSKLVGQPLPACEEAFQYLHDLRGNGRTVKLPSDKPPGDDR